MAHQRYNICSALPMLSRRSTLSATKHGKITQVRSSVQLCVQSMVTLAASLTKQESLLMNAVGDITIVDFHLKPSPRLLNCVRMGNT